MVKRTNSSAVHVVPFESVSQPNRIGRPNSAGSTRMLASSRVE